MSTKFLRVGFALMCIAIAPMKAMAGSVAKTKITQFACAPSVCWFDLKDIISGNAPCSKNPATFNVLLPAANDPTYEYTKVQVALILSAYTTGKDVSVSGTGSCNGNSGTEVLSIIQLK